MSRTTQPSYEFARVADACAATGAPLRPGDAFVAALFEAEDERLERRDFAAAAWNDDAPPAGVFAFWKGVVPEPSKSNRLALPFDSLVDLFEQLEGAEDARRVAFRYVLALLLARKRLVTIVGERAARAGEPGALLVRPKGAEPTEPPVEVSDPGLDEAALGAVTDQVAEVLRLDA